jgi:hypothetical protein
MARRIRKTMRTILLTHDYEEAAKGLEGKFPSPSHVRKTLTKDTKLIAKDGTVCALLLRDVIPTPLHKLAYELWSTVDQLPDNRVTAVGTASLFRRNSDGNLGKRRGVVESVKKILRERNTAHGLIGYLDAAPDHRCHRTPLTSEHPEMLEGNERLIKLVDELYKFYLGPFYRKQRAEIEKVPPWRLWETVFSTIYLAKNFRTAYHFDGGNLKGVMTALMPMGNFTGGELVFPRWRYAIGFRPGDLLFFNSAEILHGNLPIFGERLSAAFYCERHIAECGK